jgi:hypothetical protein
VPTVQSMPQPGQLVGAPVQPCPIHGVVVVTLQYGAGADPQDGDVVLVPPAAARQQNGNVFYFTVTDEDQYEVRVRSASWSVLPRYEYQAYAEPNTHTSVVVPLHVHAVAITAQQGVHFVPGLDTVWFDYAITGDPGSVRGIDLEVFQGAVQASTQAIAGPFAANGRATWTPAAGLRLVGNPYDVRLRLTSDCGRVCVSNTVTLDIEAVRVAIEVDRPTIDAMPAGRDRVALKICDDELRRSGTRTRCIVPSPVFKTSAAELTSGASYVQYATHAQQGLWIPLLARVFLRRVDGTEGESSAALAGTTIHWRLRLETDGEFGNSLAARQLRGPVVNFLTTATAYQQNATRPPGRTAHSDLFGMRSAAATRTATERHWRRRDPAWAHTQPAARDWDASTECDAKAGSTAASGVDFRPGRFAGDVHVLRAYLALDGTFDNLSDAPLDGAPAPRRSAEIAIETWRFVPIVHDFWIGDLAQIAIPEVRAEYDRACIALNRDIHDEGDRTAWWQGRYTAARNHLVNVTGDAFAAAAMLPACGVHPAAFRSYGDYLDRAYPGFGNVLIRAQKMLTAADKQAYADDCERYSYAVIKTLAGAACNAAVASDGISFFHFEGQGLYNLQADLQGGTYVSGVALDIPGYSDRTHACFFVFNAVPNQTTITHELGHVLFLAHAPGHYNPGQSAAGTEPDHHDAADVCIMGYAPARRGFCGLCMMKLAGYDYTRIGSDGAII